MIRIYGLYVFLAFWPMHAAEEKTDLPRFIAEP